MLPIRFGVAVITFRGTNQFWIFVASDVRECGRFVVGDVEHDVLRPVAVGTLGILKPRGRFTRKADDQDVVPAVLVEIMSEREKIVRVFVFHSQRALETFDGLLGGVGRFAFEGLGGRIIFMPLCEIRSFIPIRAGDDVGLAVAIEVAERRAFAPELVGELGLLEGVQRIIPGEHGEAGDQKCCEAESCFIHGACLAESVVPVKRDGGCAILLVHPIFELAGLHPIPKGLRRPAQGCKERATLGRRYPNGPDPNGVSRSHSTRVTITGKDAST